MNLNKVSRLTLRDFQAEDVIRLVDQPGVLAVWEMGTGKTRFGLALDLMRRNPGDKTLVVCPTAAVMNVWINAYKTLTDLTVAGIDPKNRDLSWEVCVMADVDIIVVHWAALQLMPQLMRRKWKHVIADEVHAICNRKTNTSVSLKLIKSEFKTGLSGTPTDGRPDKLWSILNWLYPKEFSAYHTFFAMYCDSHIQYPGGYRVFDKPMNMSHLHSRMAPFYTIHKKRDKCCERHPKGVATHMPPKPDPVEMWVDMTPTQKKQYEAMRKDMIAWIRNIENAAKASMGLPPEESLDDLDLSGFDPLIASNAVSKMTRMLQIACAPMAVIGDKPKLIAPSPKIDAAMELILDNPTEKILVFSPYSQVIDLVKAACVKAKVSGSEIRGGQTQSERQSEIDFFIRGGGRVLLATIKSGGEAIDGLQHVSSSIIFIGREHNPGRNEQAIGRLDRDGQKVQVQVWDIMARDTLDAGRHQKLSTKIGWIKEVLGA